jgi:hypothetical protein
MFFEVDAHWDEHVKLHSCHLGTFDIPGRCFLISRQRQQLKFWVRMDGRGIQKKLAFAEVAKDGEFPSAEILNANQGLGVETSFMDDLSQYTT